MKPPPNEPPDSPPLCKSPLASPSHYPLESSHSKNPSYSNTWVLTLDPYLTMEAAMKHICWKINAAHPSQTVAAVAHRLRYDSSATDRGIRSSPCVLFRIWQSCVLSFATENLRCLVTNSQIDAVERTLIHSLATTHTTLIHLPTHHND